MFLMAVFSYLSHCFISFISLILPPRYIKNLCVFLKTLPRDLGCAYTGLAIILKSYYLQTTNQTTLTFFSKNVKKSPKKVCFYFKDEVWTFEDVDKFSNRIAFVFHEAGFRKGDAVALMMTNRPEFVCIWLGLAKLGVVTALINTNLNNHSLYHSISIANSKAVIFSDDMASAVSHIRERLDCNIKLYQWKGDIEEEGVEKLEDLLGSVNEEQFVPPSKINYNDHLVYIYTSGTTGLPKAAIMPHSRFLMLYPLLTQIIKINCNDIGYIPLPLYHTAGGSLGIGISLLVGGTTVIRNKFSASAYIPDCIKYKCTVGQYIGEICRYMLAIPVSDHDKSHHLRLMFGNGLRPAIWTKFVHRFQIPKMMEMYGSTEGNLQFVNTEGRFGAVGFIPRFLPFSKYIGLIVKYDINTETILRNSDGLCIPADIGEPGMFVGVIPLKNAVKEVHGYLDKNESSKKFIHNVLKNGDKAFVSGDLMVMDELGYIYFKDRTGDTFRWKGENVATSEVESVISSIIGLRDCIVYSVQIGDLEGRAGMAAIVDTNGDLNLDDLANCLDRMLPKYAHPIFLRIMTTVELTGTFKLKKTNLQNEGFNPETIKEPLYFRKGSTYVPVTRQLYNQIQTGLVKL